MSQTNRFSEIIRFLEIMPGEGKMAVLALCATFFHGVSSIYLFSTSHALFLTYFNAEELPYTYIGGALTVLLVGSAFSALQHRVPQLQLIIGTLFALLITMLGAWAWLMLGNPKWPSAFLAVWTVAYTTLTYMALWGLFGRIFDTRQAKRLFGLIGAGEFAADILSGFVTPFVVSLIGSVHLLLVAALGLFLMAAFTILLARVHHTNDQRETSREPEPASLPLIKLLKERYPLLLHLIWGLSLMTFYMMDTAFSNQLEKHYADSLDGMTSFLGVFFAVGSAINMLIETFLTGRVLNKIGILKTLFILPVGVLLGCLSLFGSQLFVPRIGFTVFILAIGTKMFDYVVRNALHDPAFQVLYQPLPASKRFAIQSSVLIRAESTAALIGGGALLLGRLYFEIDAVNIAWIISIILAIQIGLTFLIRGQYLQSLMNALKTRRFGLEKTVVYDQSGIDILLGWLDSRHPGEVIYSLKLLEKNAPQKLGDRFDDLLNHSSAEVRSCALEGIERLGPTGTREKVLNIIKDTSLPNKVRAQAVLAYCALDEAGAVELAYDLLQSNETALYKAAMTGLLRYCGIEGVLIAGDKFLSMLHSDNAARRVDAAGIIGESAMKAFYRPIRNLLRDKDRTVRRAAFLAAEKLANPRLIPALIPHLANPKDRVPAIRAIAATGDQALADLVLTLTKPGQTPDIVKSILRAVSRIPSFKATEFLMEHLFYPDADVRRLIFSKLQARGYQAKNDEEKKLLQGLLNQEGAFCTWVLNALTILSGEKDLDLLKNALQQTLQDGLKRILAGVSLLSPPQAIRTVQHNLNKEKDKRANALEMLDSLITEELRQIIHPLVDDLSPSQRLGQLRKVFPVTRLNVKETLSDIVIKKQSWMGPWPRALALYAMGTRRDEEFIEVIKQMMSSPVPIIRETALWAADRIQIS